MYNGYVTTKDKKISYKGVCSQKGFFSYQDD